MSKQLSMPNVLLRLEGFVVLGVAAMLYANGGYSWWYFAALLLVPDLAMFPYAINQRWGAIAYNAVHTYVGPLLLALFAITTDNSLGIQLVHLGVSSSTDSRSSQVRNLTGFTGPTPPVTDRLRAM